MTTPKITTTDQRPGRTVTVYRHDAHDYLAGGQPFTVYTFEPGDRVWNDPATGAVTRSRSMGTAVAVLTPPPGATLEEIDGERVVVFDGHILDVQRAVTTATAKGWPIAYAPGASFGHRGAFRNRFGRI